MYIYVCTVLAKFGCARPAAGLSITDYLWRPISLVNAQRESPGRALDARGLRPRRASLFSSLHINTLSLSLSHTHTHTHTHILSLSLSLSVCVFLCLCAMVCVWCVACKNVILHEASIGVGVYTGTLSGSELFGIYLVNCLLLAVCA